MTYKQLCLNFQAALRRRRSRKIYLTQVLVHPAGTTLFIFQNTLGLTPSPDGVLVLGQCTVNTSRSTLKECMWYVEQLQKATQPRLNTGPPNTGWHCR